MSKFDKYFKMYVQRMEVQFIDFPVPLVFYDTLGNPIYINKVQKERNHNDEIRLVFSYMTDDGKYVITSDEDSILTPDEIWYLRTTMGRLLYG